MNSAIHFEQLIEEIRIANPAAQTIWGTESPLSVMMDNIPLSLEPYLQAHQPAWLSVVPASLIANGLTSVIVHAHFPASANLQLPIRLQQGQTTLTETIPLDQRGDGDLELCTQTVAEILVELVAVPVRISIPVHPPEA